MSLSPGGVPSGVPEAVILTHQVSLAAALRPRFRAKHIRGLFSPLLLLPRTRGCVVLAGPLGVGGPATALTVEELAVAGVRRVVMLGVAASLSTALGAGDLLVVEDALATDGTSQHYLPVGQRLVPADAGLVARLRAALPGTQAGRGVGAGQLVGGCVASTDAPFRETAALVASFRREGACPIDMETAALLRAASALGVAAAALLVGGDQLLDTWQPPANRAALALTLRQAAATAMSVLMAQE